MRWIKISAEESTPNNVEDAAVSQRKQILESLLFDATVQQNVKDCVEFTKDTDKEFGFCAFYLLSRKNDEQDLTGVDPLIKGKRGSIPLYSDNYARLDSMLGNRNKFYNILRFHTHPTSKKDLVVSDGPSISDLKGQLYEYEEMFVKLNFSKKSTGRGISDLLDKHHV